MPSLPMRRAAAATIAACAVAALLSVTHASVAAAQGATERPNILFIFSDDHAEHAISAYGSKINETPHIDRLAREGMIFRRSFCTNSICGPSRAVILTGKHSHLNGFMTNRDRFDGSQQTFPKLLRAAGYQTAMIGKWHLKTEPTGFDFWKVLIGQGPYYNPPLRTPDGVERTVGYTTDIITDVALDWLGGKRDRSKPFLLMLQHKAPHRDWEPGPDHLHLYDDVTIPEPPTLFDDWSDRTSAASTQAMTVANHMSKRDLKLTPPPNLTPAQLAVWNAAYGPKNRAFEAAGLEGDDLVRWNYQRYIKDYLRCVAAVDDSIGRVLAYLDESGLAENTVVAYSSDQGFYLGDHGWYDKRWMYEESLRMPLIVRWPGVTAPGSSDRHLVQNLDYAETFLDIAGVEIPGDMQGRSLVPLLRGEDPDDWRDSIYYHYYEFPGPHSVRRHLGVRTEKHKLIRYYRIEEEELFDLESDPDELHSVHDEAAYADVKRDLEAELARLQELYGDTDPEHPLMHEQGALRARARRVETERVLALDAAPREAPRAPDPTAKPLTVGARCVANSKDGVIIAQGGESFGYSLWIRDGVPRFSTREEGAYREVAGDAALPRGEAVHIAGRVDADGRLHLLVDGEEVARGEGLLLSQQPADGLSIGDDTGSRVAPYPAGTRLDGELRDIRIYWGSPAGEEMARWVAGESR